MSISYQWIFQQLDVASSYEGLNDVIRVVHWRYVGTDSGVSFETYGEQALNDPDPLHFTAFASVTSDQVQGWVTGLLGTDAIAALQDQISAQITAQQSPALIPMQLSA